MVTALADLSVTQAPHPYSRYADFYAAEYGPYIRKALTLGPFTLLDIHQPAGDFSDKATQDISIMRAISRQQIHANLGAGRFSQWGSRGDIALNPAGFDNEIIVDQPHRIDVLSVSLSTLRTYDAELDLPQDGDFGAAHAGVHKDIALNSFFDRLWRYADDPIDELEEQTVTAGLAKHLGSLASPRIRLRKPFSEKLAPHALKIAKECLDERKNPSLAEIASLCRLSPYHFCRAFKAETGLPPHRWQIAHRISQARRLLAETDRSVADIGADVGYGDPAYFSRLFARETGFSPSVWRRMNLF